MDTTFTLDQLSGLTDLPLRTIRYYIQLGLVERHEGDRKHARYTQRHLDQLLQVLDLGAMSNPMFRGKGPLMVAQKAFDPNFPLKHAQKDMK